MTTLRVANFCMYTHINNMTSYDTLQYEFVLRGIRGGWRSKTEH